MNVNAMNEGGDNMLELTGVTKRFGKQVAVDQISLTVKPGEILGLIGQNGAGKTTTFRMILDFFCTLIVGRCNGKAKP